MKLTDKLGGELNAALVALLVAASIALVAVWATGYQLPQKPAGTPTIQTRPACFYSPDDDDYLCPGFDNYEPPDDPGPGPGNW